MMQLLALPRLLRAVSASLCECARVCACVCASVSLLKYLYNKVVADDGVGSRSRRLPAQLRFSFSCTCRKLVLLRRAAWAAACEAWHANLAHDIWPVGLLADWLVGRLVGLRCANS